MSTSRLHQYPSVFSRIPTSNMGDHEHHILETQHPRPTPLDTLAHASQYEALQFQQNRPVMLDGNAVIKSHRLPYVHGPLAAAAHSSREAMLRERLGRGAATSGPVRRRISRACDQCNQLRTKCDGKRCNYPQHPSSVKSLTRYSLRTLYRYVHKSHRVHRTCGVRRMTEAIHPSVGSSN
jgi:hypothetical protein